MGDAALPATPVILLAFVREVPRGLSEELQTKFPEAEVNSLVLGYGDPIPSDEARKATVIVTFANLPAPEDAQQIKLIHFFSAGIDHLIDHPIFAKTSIPVTTSSGIHGPPIAEWAVLNWLASSKRFIHSYENQKKHVWGGHDGYSGVHDQVGRKVGILGYGSIGRQIGRVSAALGMTVHAYTASPRPTPASRRDNGYIVPGTGDRDGTIPTSWHHGTDKASLHEFLSIGLDHIVVSLPLTPQTTHILGAEEFALLAGKGSEKQPNPYLTNISRGKVIDQDALINSLKSGELSGAALDVTDPEPLPEDHPLWDAPNVQISPHVSGLGKEYFLRSLDVLRVNLDRLDKGERLINEYKRGKAY